MVLVVGRNVVLMRCATWCLPELQGLLQPPTGPGQSVAKMWPGIKNMNNLCHGRANKAPHTTFMESGIECFRRLPGRIWGSGGFVGAVGAPVTKAVRAGGNW